MSNISTPAIIIAILAILGIVFFLYFKKEGTVKKAALLLAILVLTTVLGLLANEVSLRIKNTSNRSDNDINAEIDDSNKDTITIESQNDNIESSTKIESIADFFYFISPMARGFIKDRDKTYSPDWLLLVLSLIGTLFLTIGPILENRPHSFREYFGYIIVGLVLSYVNFYLIFIIACMATGIVSAIVSYFIIFLITIGLFEWIESM